MGKFHEVLYMLMHRLHPQKCNIQILAFFGDIRGYLENIIEGLGFEYYEIRCPRHFV